MSDYRTRVHIADEPKELQQRCWRCGEILTDMRNSASMDGRAPLFWQSFCFVGVSEMADGRKCNPTGYVMMDRDASEADEIACTP
mgnify:CR=1 FL=1